MLKDNIYYVDQDIFNCIEADFDFIEKKNWYLLYRNRIDHSFWRLDESDKYQAQMLIKLKSRENWENFDDQYLRMDFLKQQRGLSKEQCKWKGCDKYALNDLVFCELHAYKEMGIVR